MNFQKYQLNHWFLNFLALSIYLASEAKYLTRGLFCINFWDIGNILWDLDSGNPTIIFGESELDFREKPLQVAILPISAWNITKARKKSEDCHLVTSYAFEIIHWDLGRRTLVGGFGGMRWNFKEGHMLMRFREFSAKNFSAVSIKKHRFSFQNYSKTKSLKQFHEKVQSVVLEEEVPRQGDRKKIRNNGSLVSSIFQRKNEKKIGNLNDLVQKQNW